MSRQINPEQSYSRDYSRLPIALIREEQYSSLSFDAMYLFSFLCDIENAAFKSRQINDGHVWFTVKSSLVRTLLGFTGSKTKKCLMQLEDANLINSSSKDRYYLIRFSSYKNANGSIVLAKYDDYIRLPRYLRGKLERDEEGHFISSFEKIIYAYILHRTMLSLTTDENKTRFTVIPNEQMTDLFRCNLNKITSYAYRHLEAAGLLTRDHSVSGKIYLTGMIPVEAEKPTPKSSVFFADDVQKTVQSEVQKNADINTKEFLNTKKDNLDDSSLSQNIINERQELHDKDGDEQSVNRTNSLIDSMLISFPDRSDDLGQIRKVMNWVNSYTGKEIHVSKVAVSSDKVKTAISKIERSDILSVMNCISKNRDHITDMRSYLLPVLYHIKQTASWHRTDKVSAVNKQITVQYADNRFIPSHEYDYAAILQKQRERLYSKDTFAEKVS